MRPIRAYLSVPTRPPAEKWVQTPPAKNINRAYNIFHERIDRIEYLIGYEGNAFSFTGNVKEDLLGITAVHPMREEAVSELLVKAGAYWTIVHNMIDQGQLVEVVYEGRKFYMRRLYK